MESVFDILTKDRADDISLYIQEYIYNITCQEIICIRQWTHAFCAPRFGLTSDCCDNLRRRSNVVVGKLTTTFIYITPTTRPLIEHCPIGGGGNKREERERDLQRKTDTYFELN